MSRFTYILLAFIIIALPQWASACSCYSDKKISELVNEGAVIFLASPVGNISYDKKWFTSKGPKRLKVWKSYTSQLPDYVDLDTGAGGSCYYPIHNNQTSVIIARPQAEGVLRTNYCLMNEYSRSELLNYAISGIDTQAISLKRQFCFQIIKQAYDSEVFVGEWKMEDESCLKYKNKYDTLYRVKIIE